MAHLLGFLVFMAAAAFGACTSTGSTGIESCTGNCDNDSDCGPTEACLVTNCGVCLPRTNIACTDGGTECGSGALCDTAEGICLLKGP
jgi:hypothetical protein